jgi:hypothetical protein
MAYNIAYVLAFRGEADRAFEWLDKAVACHDGGLAEIVGSPPFANLRQDPRWLPRCRLTAMNGRTTDQEILSCGWGLGCDDSAVRLANCHEGAAAHSAPLCFT